MSFLTVRGMQSSGLITCAKHYLLYEQDPVCNGPLGDDGGRTDCHQVSSEVDGESGFQFVYEPKTRRGLVHSANGQTRH